MAEFDPNSRSFFDSFSSAVAQDLLTLQLTAGQPEPTEGVNRVSDPIVPDRVVRDRLSHFDPEIYDLRDESHLMKLLKVLLGGAGIGGLRKQLMTARLQNTFSGMHFLDLDRFYGALFGIKRAPNEVYQDLNFDPYNDATTPDGWDDIHSRDASYRDRLAKFAKTIPMGATYAGLKAMAEALTSVECEIYESWSLVDDYLASAIRPKAVVYTYDFLSTGFPDWSELEGTNWNQWGGGSALALGRTGQNTRSDFVVTPKRPLTASESYELLRVLDRFRPAGTQFTVDPNGLAIHQRTDVRGVAASSEYWEVVSKTVPSDYVIGEPWTTLPRPAFSGFQGEEWFYNDDVLFVTSEAYDGDDVLWPIVNDEEIVFSDGIRYTFRASDAILPGAQAMSGRIVSDGVMTAGAYAESRAHLQGVGR